MLLTRIALALGTLVIGGIAATILGLVLIAVLASTGGGGDDTCRPPGPPEADDDLARPVTRDADTAALFQQRWDDLRFQALSGGALSATFSESEVTSRASQYLDDRNAPLKDILVCFHEGRAEARARAEVPSLGGIPLLGGLFDTNVRVAGSIDLSGEHPRLVIDELEAGNLPGFLEDAVRDEAEDAVNSRLTDLDVDFSYGVTFREGEAAVSIAP